MTTLPMNHRSRNTNRRLTNYDLPYGYKSVLGWKIIRETAKAMLVEHREKQVWFPKSQSYLHWDDRCNHPLLLVKRWLYDQEFGAA